MDKAFNKSDLRKTREEIESADRSTRLTPYGHRAVYVRVRSYSAAGMIYMFGINRHSKTKKREYPYGGTAYGKAKYGRANFGGKIKKLLILASVIVVAVGGITVLAKAPDKSVGDQDQLKHELEKNAEDLKEREDHEKDVSPALAYAADKAAEIATRTKEGAAAEQGTSDAEQGTADTSNSSTSQDTVVSSDEWNLPFESAEAPSVTFIGGSILLGASPSILEVAPNCVVDADVSRQVWDGADIVNSLKSEGKLYDTVVIELGINCPFPTDMGQEVLDAIGSDHKIYWVKPYGKYMTNLSQTYEVLSELEQNNANLTILDWPAVAEANPDWFYDDGIHLNSDGQKGFTEYIFNAIY